MNEKTYRLLIVGDHPATAKTLITMLEIAPFKLEIAFAVDAQSADEELRRIKYDGMVLDLMLPGRTAAVLLSTLNEDPAFRRFPVLVYSPVENRYQEDHALKNQQNLRIVTLPRPYSPTELIEKIRDMVRLEKN